MLVGLHEHEAIQNPVPDTEARPGRIIILVGKTSVGIGNAQQRSCDDVDLHRRRRGMVLLRGRRLKSLSDKLSTPTSHFLSTTTCRLETINNCIIT